MLRAAPFFLLLACATTPPPGPPPPEALPPSAVSSVNAVLQHAEELGLTAEQKSTLQSLDDQLATKQNELREKARTAATAKAKDENPMADVRGSGSMGGMGGVGRGRGAMAPSRHGPSHVPPDVKLRDQLDTADTAAFLEAEKSLTEEQKPKAREYASKYREQLFNYRATHPEF